MQILIKSKQHISRPGEHFASCHASTLIELRDGTVVAAWFAGTHENHVDVGIWTARRTGGVWSAPVRALCDGEWPCWNPVLHLGANGVVYLFYKVGPTPRAWWTMMSVSRDNAETWCAPKRLVDGDDFGRGPVKNKMIVTRDRRWLAPASRESEERWEAFVDISEDCGKTWSATAMVPMDREKLAGQGVIQPTLWESAPGHVHMLLRSSEKAIYRSDSADGGRSWCKAYATTLPNNNSGIDAVRMADGTLALVSNPVGVNWGARTPLTLSLSKDNGQTWPTHVILEENPEALTREDGEFSYPAVVASGNRLLITYTWKRKVIEFVELEVKA